MNANNTITRVLRELERQEREGTFLPALPDLADSWACPKCGAASMNAVSYVRVCGVCGNPRFRLIPVPTLESILGRPPRKKYASDFEGDAEAVA